MEEILILIIQCLFELILNIPWGLPSKLKNTPGTEFTWPDFCLWFLGASFLGWISLFVFGHTFISSPGLRITNLVISPLLSATFCKTVATMRARNNANIVPSFYFWQAFWFTLGFTMVRFAYATHP